MAAILKGWLRRRENRLLKRGGVEDKEKGSRGNGKGRRGGVRR